MVRQRQAKALTEPPFPRKSPRLQQRLQKPGDVSPACTGPVDYISDGVTTLALSRGVPQLPKLVGTGCMVNSIIASYLSVADNTLEAAALGVLTMCAAGEAAAVRLTDASQLCSFETFLMDQIAML